MPELIWIGKRSERERKECDRKGVSLRKARLMDEQRNCQGKDELHLNN